jgi:putative N6-adenine-specific DNA methylase
MFDFQEHGRYFAQFPDGAEAVATADLVALGAENVEPGYRGVYFNAERDALYRIVYRTLTVTRVLAPLVHFQCHTPEYLYKKVRSIDWSAMIGTDQTFAVFATVSNSAIRHSQYAALTVKDAVVDQFRERAGSRPNVDTTDPDLWINLYLHANRATLSLDASGGSMHRRGYRVESVEAPMQETVAAAMVAMSEWDGETPLIDPMCGSGTLLCEALMRYARVPSGYLRARFGVERFPDFDAALWKHQRADADAGIRQLNRGLISGSDSDPAAARAARTNLSRLPAGVNVRVERRRFEDIEQIKGVTILTNPPYGVRIGRRDAMPDFVRGFGDFLKHRCTGSTAYVYFGNRELTKSIGLRPSWRRPLANGGLDGRLLRFDLFEGPRTATASRVARDADS